MTDLIFLPIEPLVERYTQEWYDEFPKAFEAAGLKVTVIDGTPLADEVKVGTFLDINSTCYYKFTQLQRVAYLFHTRQVKDGTVFFVGDIEFWGIESIRLMARMNGVKVFLAGFLHAASYTKDDAFAIAADYQRYTECGWIAAFDKVFVGSHYHKFAVLERRLPITIDNEKFHGDLADRLVVTKNPIFLDSYPKMNCQKQRKVLLTNRFDIEKDPYSTLRLFKEMKAEFPDWEFVVTTSRSTFRSNTPELITVARRYEEQGIITIKAGLTKKQYYTELCEAAIMVTHSPEENYGYCIAEAMLYNCVPLMRLGASHPEFIDDERCFFDPSPAVNKARPETSDTSRLRHLIQTFGTSNFPRPPDSQLDCSGMDNIVREILALTQDQPEE